MTLDWFLKQAWRRAAGMPEEDWPRRLPDLSELQDSEWCADFEHMMRRRLIMGAFRYGRFGDPGKGAYDAIGSILHRAERYRVDGNLEHLVDIANLAMVEFSEGRHPKRHFRAQDDELHALKT